MKCNTAMRSAIVLMAVLAMGLAAPLGAAQQGAHDHGPAATSGLQLNKGKKWATDEPLRLGMNRMLRCAWDQFYSKALARL